MLTKFARQIEERGKLFDDQRIKLLERLGKKVEKGNYQINKGKEEEFSKLMTELLEVEESYDMDRIKLDDDVKIAPKDLIMLEKILVE
jgi:hypothetical protein